MPQPGQTRQFPNGHWGRWDGQGWEAIPGDPNLHSPTPEQSNPSSFTEDAVTKVGLPALGAVIGGKTPLGPIGAGLGAATGKGIGDLYNMISGHTAPPSMGDEAAHLGEVATGTALGVKAGPPVLRAASNLVPRGGMGLLGSTGLGFLFGHPQIGAGIGAVAETAPKIARGVEWFGEPAGQAAINSSGTMKQALAKMSPLEQAFQDTSMPSFRQAAGYLGEKGSQAMSGLKNLYTTGRQAVQDYLHPPIQATPPSQSFPDVRQTLESTKTSNPSVRPDLSNTPTRRWNADVTVDPRVTAPSGPPQVNPRDAGVRAPLNQGTGPRVTPEAPTSSAAPPLVTEQMYREALASGKIPPNTSLTDFGLMSKEGRLPFARSPFGPNTVGAAQDPNAHLGQMLDDLNPLSRSEFPPGTSAQDWRAPATQREGIAQSRRWEDLWNQHENATADPSAVAHTQSLISRLLDLANVKGQK